MSAIPSGRRSAQPDQAAALPNVRALPDYAELHCLTNYSFLQGASYPEELVARADELGYCALAITDECSMAGVVRAHVEAKNRNLPLIIGSFFTLSHDASSHDNGDREALTTAAKAAGTTTRTPGTHATEPAVSATAPTLSLVVLARNRHGYGNLCEFITLGRRRAPKGQYRLSTQDITHPGTPELAHLRGLEGCIALVVPDHGASPETLTRQAQWARRAFPGRCWLALTLLHQAGDSSHKATVLAVARQTGLPVAATGQVNMHKRSRKPLHDTLTAIRLHSTVEESGFQRASNAERHLRARVRLAGIYPPETLNETARIAGLCQFNLKELRYDYPSEICPAGTTPATYLRAQVLAGARRRYPGGTPENVQGQIEAELALIAQLEYESYFLTIYDIITFARRHDILCQGRGSAANSAVCYCLGITEVDPARGNTLFERFISKERGEPPDIDVDFEHHRREEVIQYIYRKYGHDHAALTAVAITYRTKSALRDTGKALGIDPAIIEAMAKTQSRWGGRDTMAVHMRECGLDPASPTARQWILLTERLLGFPRHLSQHPGGFVISRGPLCRLVPVENAAMPGRSVVQWDKDDLDAMGLLKIDILALGMLSVIQRTLRDLSHRYGRPFTMQNIPTEDPATYAMISRADTIGLFQVESRAQMSMLPRLRPRCFYDLVIEVAIIRPGPIQGGMLHPYLRRRQGLEPVTYPGPAIKKALERTKGVPIFQEQVMQVAMLAAGFTAGEADNLRRSMAAWKRKGGLAKYYDKIVTGMTARGYDKAFAEQIFHQIEGFGEYGFPESHAASFALLAYASGWLKCHEPAAYLAALLNSQPMGFYSRSTLVQDARRHGVRVLPVDVANSNWEATLHYPPSGRPAVRLGMNQVKGMSRASAQRIEQARKQHPLAGIADLARRARLSRRDLAVLAAADALRPLTGHRRAALWHTAPPPQPDLFAAVCSSNTEEEEHPELAPMTEGQSIVADYRSLGLTLGRHPLALLRDRLSAMRFLCSAQLRGQPDRRLVRACGIVTVRQRPQTAKGMVFITLEDETGQVNLVVRPDIARRQPREMQQAQLLGAYGTWQARDGVQNLLVARLVDLTSLLGRLQTTSRDFH